MYNEQFRKYTVIVINKNDEIWKLRERTRDEAKTAVQHWLPSWTTKACCVNNTENHGSKWWYKTRKGIETRVIAPWAQPTSDTTTETTTTDTSTES